MIFEKGKCVCGSGKTHEKCCKLKPNYSFEYTNLFHYRHEAKKQLLEFSMPCVYTNCGKNPIKSHALQNRKILKSIQEDNHIYVVDTEIIEDRPKVSFSRKGVNQSTIFKCLCSEHDKALFKEIEDSNYVGTEQQKFLFAFKALLYAHWKSENNYSFWSSNFYQKYNVKNLLKNPYFLEQFISNHDDKYRLRKLVAKYMDIYNNANYSAIKSFCIILDYKISFCCCCNTFISNMLNGTPIDEKKGIQISSKNTEIYYPTISITCFSENGKSHVIFSWLNEEEDNAYYNKFFNQFLLKSKNYVCKVLNVLLPTLSEEIYFSPRLIDNLSEHQKKDLITLLDCRTLCFYQKEKGALDKWAEQVTFDLFKKLK